MSKIDAAIALKGVTKKWLKIITADMLKDLPQILDSVSEHQYTPNACDIFKFARFSLADVKAVILAWDPYKDADGLAFSSRAQASTSLERIFSRLQIDGLIKNPPASNDLSHWAAQGVVLLNCSLTARRNSPGSHVPLWSAWMDRVIKNLSRELPDKTIWCLWGSDVAKKAELIDMRHTVLRHCHPLQIEPPGFLACDHFLKIADKYPGFVWGDDTETHYYTDCSARNNQSKTCRASYGVVCTRGLMADRQWSGEILAKMIVQKGVKTATEARPTNIRGEGFALIRALQLAASLPKDTRVKIHTDSKFWAVDMLTDYIPKWVDRGVPFTSKANSDISEQLWQLYQSKTSLVELVFVNAWHDRARPKKGADLDWWLGNQAAEKCAEEALGL